LVSGATRDKVATLESQTVKIFFASSNSGKLREYQELANGSVLEVTRMPNLGEIAPFHEAAPTFAENAVDKALYYSRYIPEMIFTDDSGLSVPALGGAPGVHSARYAGPNGTPQDCVLKLLGEMEGKEGGERRARFVCVIALAQRNRILAVVSDLVEGMIAKEPRGREGFGYDPVFCFPAAGKTFAEISPDEKNRYSHRGKAFRKVVEFLSFPASPPSPATSNDTV
jgi:XTP/dITP diphosphohydrolase